MRRGYYCGLRHTNWQASGKDRNADGKRCNIKRKTEKMLLFFRKFMISFEFSTGHLLDFVSFSLNAILEKGVKIDFVEI